MSLALIICLIGLVVYLITDAVGKYQAVGEAAKLAFAVGLLAFLIK